MTLAQVKSTYGSKILEISIDWAFVLFGFEFEDRIQIQVDVVSRFVPRSCWTFHRIVKAWTVVVDISPIRIVSDFSCISMVRCSDQIAPWKDGVRAIVLPKSLNVNPKQTLASLEQFRVHPSSWNVFLPSSDRIGIVAFSPSELEVDLEPSWAVQDNDCTLFETQLVPENVGSIVLFCFAGVPFETVDASRWSL